MIFQHVGAALRGRFFFNFWHAGLYPDVASLITRVKLQVDWSKGLEAMACGCLKSGALVLAMIVDLTTVLTLRTTVIQWWRFFSTPDQV